MAIVYRNVVGPVHDSQGDPLATGVLTIKLREPLADGVTLITPESVQVDIVAGAFTIPLAAPGVYDFTVVGPSGGTYWSFQSLLDDDVGTDITLSELYLLQQPSC